MNGRVAVLRAYGGEFELREYPVPDPEPGAILVRLATITSTELQELLTDAWRTQAPKSLVKSFNQL